MNTMKAYFTEAEFNAFQNARTGYGGVLGLVAGIVSSSTRNIETNISIDLIDSVTNGTISFKVHTPTPNK